MNRIKKRIERKQAWQESKKERRQRMLDDFERRKLAKEIAQLKEDFVLPMERMLEQMKYDDANPEAIKKVTFRLRSLRSTLVQKQRKMEGI